MAGFSLKSSMRNVRANYEDFDNEGLPVGETVDEVIETTSVAADEAAAAGEVAQLNESLSDADQADAVVEQIEDTVADGEAVIEAADEEAAASGDAPAIDPKDVAVMQEKVRTFVSMTDGDGINFVLSSEAADKDGYNTFRVNLEGLKEVGERVKKFISDIWKKIVETFDRVVSYIKRLLPTKLNRLRALSNKLNELDKSRDMKKGEEGYKRANENFRKNVLANQKAVASAIGVNLENAANYSKTMIDQVVAAAEAIKNSSGPLADKQDVKEFMDSFKTNLEKIGKGDIDRYLASKKDAKEMARHELSNDTAVNKAFVTGIGFSGNNVKVSWVAEVSKPKNEEDDDADAIDYIWRSGTYQEAADIKFGEGSVKFDIKKTADIINEVIKNADAFVRANDKLNANIKTFRKDVADGSTGNAFTKWYEGRAAEKTLRKLVSSTMMITTSYDSGFLGYCLAYGNACLTAYNAGKVTKKDKTAV